MQEVQPGEAGKVGIEGDQAATAGEGEGGEVSIRPESMRESGWGGEGLKVCIQTCGFGQKLDIGECYELLVNSPRFGVGFGIRYGLGACGDTKETQHRDAAEGKLGSTVLAPVVLGQVVMNVSFIHECHPDIDVEQVAHGWGLDGLETRWKFSMSSSSRMAQSSALERAGVTVPSVSQATGRG